MNNNLLLKYYEIKTRYDGHIPDDKVEFATASNGKVYAFDPDTHETSGLGENNAELERRRKSGYKEQFIISQFVGTEEWKKAFLDIFDSDDFDYNNVCKSVIERSIVILKHRSGYDFEDLVYFDLRTGEKKGVFNYPETHKYATGMVSETKSMERFSKKVGKDNLIAVHNHPNSTLPSGSDLYKASKRYNFGLIVCHNGTIIKYKVDSSLFEDNMGFVDSWIVSIQKRMSSNDDYSSDINKLKEYGVEIHIWESG